MPVSATLEPTTAPPEGVAGGDVALSDLEVEMIELFVSAVKMLGIPKSVGEIYGFLFVNPAPLSLDDIVLRLSMSKGSASQGLKLLRSIGAIKAVYVAGDRRDHYVAETKLKQLAAGFLREEVQPRLESGGGRLDRLQALVNAQTGEQREFYAERVAKLAQWKTRTEGLLPLLTGMLDG